MKRQRGRNRSSGGNSGKPQHNTNRAFDSNGPDGVKVRGAAQNVYEKYQQLARDAHTSGDRVLAENYLQHAEHYFRVMRAMQPQRPISEIIGRDQFVSGYDIDFEDESGQIEAAEGESNDTTGNGEAGDQTERFESRRDDRPREEYRPREDYRPRDESRSADPRQRDDRPRDDRPRDDRSQGDRYQGDRPQNDRPQNDRSPGERASGDRSNRSYRDDRSRYGRDERTRAEGSERPATDAMTVVEPEATPLPTQPAASVLRADDGEVNHAPAFLQVRPAEPREEAAPAVRKPPRRRAPRVFENAEIAAAEPSSQAPATEET